jgi:hypothetical protein
MTTATERALLWLLGIYLAGFAFLSPNFKHVRREHSLIWWGIHERANDLRAEGLPHPRATLRAWQESLGELNPVALVRKTITDAAHAPFDLAQLRWYPLRLGIVGAALFVCAVLTVDPLASHAAPGGIGQPTRDAGGQTTQHLGEGPTLREAHYRATGICLAQDVTG